MNHAKLGAIAIPLSTLAACASMPKVTAGYYLPKANVEVTLTQTATCTASNIPIVKNDMIVSTTYARNPKEFHSIDLRKIEGTWSKANATFEFYDDGRLKGVNTTQTGQAGEVIKAFTTLIGATGAKLLNLQPGMKAEDNPYVAPCELLRELAGSAKPAADPKAKEEDKEKGPKALTILFRGKLDMPEYKEERDATRGKNILKDADGNPILVFDKDRPFRLIQDSLPANVYSRLVPIYGRQEASFKLTQANKNPPHVSTETEGEKIVLVDAASAAIKITVLYGGPNDPKEELTGGAKVPQLGNNYELPIQKAPMFGENKFELALNESGRVTKLAYAGGGDAAGALGALGSIAGLHKPEAEKSTADQAKDIQAEADLIYQQQRLVLCQADPANCPK